MKCTGPEVTDEEINTPMFCALYQSRNGVWGNNTQGQNVRLTSHFFGAIFWLGYLYKKISQYRCEVKVKIFNDADCPDPTKFHRNFIR